MGKHSKTGENREKHGKTLPAYRRLLFALLYVEKGPHATKEIGDVCTQARENMANKGGKQGKTWGKEGKTGVKTGKLRKTGESIGKREKHRKTWENIRKRESIGKQRKT